jgi:GNAT superfamily N-acetyltransferase
MPELNIAPERFDGVATRALTDAADGELRERYSGSLGGPVRELTPAAFEPPRGCFLVAYRGGKEVACGGVCRYDDENAELRRMYVAPEARRQGIARALLGRLEQTARELGYRRIRLATGVGQPEALKLYEAEGFERIANYGPFAAETDNVCLEKRL